ncbi:MAG: tRNA uracil 4-sulfurtransferase ThiI [Candidatus Odinarchaeia archaeon]
MFLIRYSEIGLKSDRTRKRFEKKLVENIIRKIREIEKDVKINLERGRLFLTPQTSEIQERLQKIFGVSSFSPVIETRSEKEILIDIIVEYSKKILKESDSFAIRCRKVGKHPYTSKKIEEEVGSQILKELNGKVKVNLSNPDKTIFIEIRGPKAYIYHKIIEGPGGLPVNSQGVFISLFSGGIDSPVATYLMMKRGGLPVLLYMDNTPFSDYKATEKALKAAHIIQDYASGKEIKFYIAPFGLILKHIKKNIQNFRYTCIICKRTMFRIAEKIALKEGAEAIVTGESIGQKASQTLRSSRIISNAITQVNLLRPLIAFDKIEIEHISRKIGAFETSSLNTGECGAAPKYPSTFPNMEKISEIESQLNLNDKIIKVLNNLKLKIIK